ncbi:hypothetical protein ACLMJK_000609 [Lecanora helva]
MSQTYTIVSPSDAALKPPPDVIPDFQDPFTVRPYWIMTASVGLVTTGIILALRLYTKIAVVKKCRWEDYMCCLGFIFFASFIAQVFEVVDAKGGAHQWNVTNREMEQQLFFANIEDMMYSPAVGFIKISIILLVLRIFCPVKRDPFYWALQSLNVLNTIFYTVYFIIPFVVCQPRKKIWQPQTPGKCLKVFDLYIASAVFNVCSDLVMYSAPLWKIWHLQMSKGQKLGIISIFATGGFAVGFAILRLIWAILLVFNADFSYVKMQANVFGAAELACGIICSCLFVLPRLYRHLTASPPYNSEEYRLRRYKKLASSGRRELEQSALGDVHRKEEERNPWDKDIETAAVLPVPLRRERENPR